MKLFLVSLLIVLLASSGNSVNVFKQGQQGSSVVPRLIRSMKQSRQSFDSALRSPSTSIQSALPFVLLHAVANDPAWFQRDWAIADADWLQPPVPAHGPVDVFGKIRRWPEPWRLTSKHKGFSLSIDELFGLILSHGPSVITDPTGLFMLDEYLRTPEHRDLWFPEIGSSTEHMTKQMMELQDLIYTKVNQLNLDSPSALDTQELWTKWRVTGQVSDLVRVLQLTRKHGHYATYNGGYWASALGVLQSSGTPVGTKMLTLLILARHDPPLFSTLMDSHMVMETFGVGLRDWVLFLDRFARLEMDEEHPSRRAIGTFLLKSKNMLLLHSDHQASLGLIIRGYYVSAPSTRPHLSALMDSLLERNQDLEDALFVVLRQDDPKMIQRLSDSTQEKYSLIDLLQILDQEPRKIMASMYGSSGTGTGKLWNDRAENLAHFVLRKSWDSTLQLMMSSPAIGDQLSPSKLEEMVRTVIHDSFTSETTLFKMHAFTDRLSDASFMAWILLKDERHLDRLDVVISDTHQFNRFMALLSKDPGRAIGALVQDFCKTSRTLTTCFKSLGSQGVVSVEIQSILGKLRNAVDNAKESFGANEKTFVSVIDQGIQTDDMGPEKPEKIMHETLRNQRTGTDMLDEAIRDSIKNGQEAAHVEHPISVPLAAMETAETALAQSAKSGSGMKRNGLVLVSVLATLMALGLGFFIGQHSN
jgi:hypothetical protein